MDGVALCRVDTLVEGQSYGFDPLHEGRDRVFALRYRGRVRVYLNSCPHLHVALQYRKDRYLSADGERILCYAHGAQFLPDSGECVYGPCLGQTLTSLVVSEQDGWLLLATEQLA
ncbi:MULTISPECIES: Rieske (2Fe-2S) protein [Pseudomonas]|uniref:Rieske 2Fe-2S domain-containing protein n=2 Tax=Pseudomonas TaxID=286 RepID=A0ABX6HCK4_9PSED|nr:MULTISPECIES: Rieske 2Fe-2S domain-containing protein [Pseudomonas]MBC3953573.1 Rieske 2Fe-2S domain-containing protein [Pseudomonas triticifolii]QHF03242.1 Rieske 2Fe-2S domain-containing protein [Pseudomonas asturiensis]